MIASLLIAMLLGAATPARAAVPQTPESRTAALMRKIAGDRATLRLFLQAMPKGGDLHNHLGGAIYAEDMIGWAAGGGLCISNDRNRIVPAPCDKATTLPASELAANYDRYSRTIDALSTRGFEAGKGDPALSGADRFFGTFDAFGAAYTGNVGKALAIAREQAAADNVEYLELQIGAGPLEGVLPKDWAKGIAPTDFAAMLARLDPVLAKTTAAARTGLDQVEAEAGTLQGCAGDKPSGGCGVRHKYLMAAMRIYSPDAVFAELAYGFALVRADPRVVGVNIVAPEHDPVAIRDYRLHMAMIAFLRQRFPDVPTSLHAGEITLGLVAPRDLRFHIHDAVVVAGARRIGHGMDIAYEDDALPLLQRMARERIAVEISLTSNAVILGVQGKAHPLALYRAAGVPVVLSTDDEGVSRTDMTNEYLRAATEQGLGYRDLKQIARDSIRYSFVPGESLWAGEALKPPCAASLTSPACIAFVRASEKAALEQALELQFRRFEQDFQPMMQRTLHMAQ